MKNKSVFGLSENIASALSYAGLFVTGILVFILEKENKTVRFHALQSTILFAVLCLASALFGWLPILGWIISRVLGVVTFACWIFLTYSAYKGAMLKVPVLGDVVWEQVNK